MSDQDQWKEDTAEITAVGGMGSDKDIEQIAKRWVFYCPWCGARADLNTIKPLTINCERCECTTEVRTIT
jgi:hypothetical protein